tara:strand:+ start:523 stop:708 length:186 start_codon:yes stop_codon:yes gene_type:complete
MKYLKYSSRVLVIACGILLAEFILEVLAVILNSKLLLLVGSGAILYYLYQRNYFTSKSEKL